MVSSRALACLTQLGLLGGVLSPHPSLPARGSKELSWPFVRPQGPGSHPCPEGHSRNGEQCRGGNVGSGVENLLAWRPQAPAHMVQVWRGLTRFPEGRLRLALAALTALQVRMAGRISSVCKVGCASGAWVATAFCGAKLPSSPALGPGRPPTPLLAWRLLLFIPRVFLRKGRSDLVNDAFPRYFCRRPPFPGQSSCPPVPHGESQKWGSSLG